MTLDTFTALVSDMRQAQRDYFRHRGEDRLNRSKDLERQVDQAVKALRNPTPLFAGSDQ